MEPILTIDNLNSFGGNMLRQGDKSQLKYRLRDVGNKNLGISSKSCEVKMYGRNYTTVVYETTTTVSSDNTVTFTIDKVLPKGTFYLEFTVGDYIFPTDHREFFEITPSGKGMEANIIEIVGKDVLIREVKSQVDAELQPLVTSLQAAEQAEAQRATAESSRVSAEAQRKTDHANRSAELAGKADKVVIENLITNGDFSDGTSGWTVINPELSSEEYHSPPSSFYKPEASRALYRDVPLPNDHVAYFSAFVKGTNGMELRMNAFRTWTRLGSVTIKSSDEWTILSITARSVNGGLRVDTSVWEGENYFDDFMLIDLTATFGAGNEPTKEEMDELIKVTGYIDGEYALNNKEMLGHLMNGIREKADKKQEDWITATLINGATGTVQYRKNEFGTVEMTGIISASTTGLQPFVLPMGYRPRVTFSNAITTRNSSNAMGKLTVGSSGSTFLTISNTEFDLTGINFEAGG